MALAGCRGFVDGKGAYNSTSKCCFRTAEREDRRCDTILHRDVIGKLCCMKLILLEGGQSSAEVLS
jgi:hypothetical protein